MVKLDAAQCTDFQVSSTREWLETNGIGGYASSTVSTANTRRYHGILVSATRPPLGREVLVSRYEESLIIDGDTYELSTNQYPGAVYPNGYRHIKEFRLDPFPIWTFELAGIRLERSMWMVNRENSTVCTWRIAEGGSGRQVKLFVRPLVSFRDHHHLSYNSSHLNLTVETADPGHVGVENKENGLEIHFTHSAAIVARTGLWYHNFEYAIEKERGFESHEDHYEPIALQFDLKNEAVLIASDRSTQPTDVGKLRRGEIERRAELVAKAGSEDEFASALVLAADQFIVDRGTGKTIIAGYPWFSDWGRDTMIALPGLTLATGRPDIARSILSEFAKHISEGMLPNRFPDAGDTPDYNNVDGTLWFFEAIRAYLEHTGDCDFVHGELFEKLANIIEWHIQGTRYGIHVDTDGLLYAGEAGTQLTWMDAKVGDWVVTSRLGKAVEIQALWYNALRVMEDLSAQFNVAGNYGETADVARESFNGQFWNQDLACLYDVINGDDKDSSVRPNQIFAVSLHHSMLEPAKAKAVVDRVKAELLTPYGLRSLSQNDKRYVGVYAGSPLERDGSYHQGTVWAWLIGPFVDAYRRVYPQDIDTINAVIEPFRQHLNEAMLGQISEVFDGDAPHNPRGCPAQAWSVAELLRIMSKS